MANLNRNLEDARVEGLRTASVTLVIGWVVVGFAVMCGIYLVQTYREGTEVWRVMDFVMFAIGLTLVMVGSRRRRLYS